MANQCLSLAANNVDQASPDNVTGPFSDALQRSLSTFSYSMQMTEANLPKNYLVIVVGHRWLSVPVPDFLHSKP